MGPLLPDDGPLAARLVRRVRGIVLEVVAFAAVTLLLPVLLAGAAAVDLVLWLRRRKPWMAVRLVAFLWWFLFGEIRGLLAFAGIHAITLGRDSPQRRRLVYRLRVHWCRSHLGGIRVLFGLTFEIEGLELAAPGPEIILIRHASIIDNALPDAVVGREHGIGLRYVIKRELQMLPNIDIGGRWIPTAFVRRGSRDTEAETARMRLLAQDLGDEAVLIYPEGTRHTAEKLARAQAIIQERQPDVAPLAGRLRHVLPPRLGGPIALLEAAPEADVVVCGHVGLDGFEYVSDIWGGQLVGTTVRVRFWRFPAAERPQDRDALVGYLYDCWQTLDDWVGEQRHGAAAAPPKTALPTARA